MTDSGTNAPSGAIIQVLLADDHILIRQGIRALLEEVHDIQIVGEAANGHEAIGLVEKHSPDVLLLDISMPRMNGLEALKRLKTQRPDTRIIILSMHADKAIVRNVLRNGARGYLLKNAPVGDLLQAIRYVNQGGFYVSPPLSDNLLADLLASTASDSAPALDALTEREREVLQLVAEGQTSSQIGEILFITTKTVEKHRTSLMQKLGVRDVAGLTRRAIQYGMVAADS